MFPSRVRDFKNIFFKEKSLVFNKFSLIIKRWPKYMEMCLKSKVFTLGQICFSYPIRNASFFSNFIMKLIRYN